MGRGLTLRRILLPALLVLLAAAVFALATTRPSPMRDWIPEQTRLPAVYFDRGQVRIHGVRNFRYRSRQEFEPGYDDRSFDPATISSAWFVLTPFSERWRGAAHSFVSFGFEDGRYLAISVEARRERGESYRTLHGLLRRFELIYVIGDERDLIGQRAAFGQTPVYLYPIRAPQERIRDVFLQMLRRADRLRLEPEFYNTVSNNCISNLVRHVNAVAPRTIPGGFKTLLPGYVDEIVLRLGLIDTRLSLSEARERYRVNNLARRHFDDPHFSLRIRQLTPPP